MAVSLAGALAVVTALSGGTVVGAASAATAPAKTVTITGTVSNQGGYPLAGVSVKLTTSASDTPVAKPRTNQAGAFTMKVAPSQSRSYLTAVDPAGRHLDVVIDIGRLAADSTVRKNLTMKPAGRIQGKVTLANGAPIPAAQTSSIQVYVEGEGSMPLSSKGAFVIGSLPTDDYALTIYDTAGRYAPLCYDQVPMAPDDQCQAAVTLIQVQAGKTTTIHTQKLSLK